MSNNRKLNDSTWTKSTFSDHGNACVEVLVQNDSVLIRDSKFTGDPTSQPIIFVPVTLWSEFMSTITDGGKQDRPRGIPGVNYDATNGTTTLTDSAGTTLVYTEEEWTAFIAGIRADQFSLTCV
ncbi:DUF397 domain-containing protein [Nocardia sp. NPDC004068]|uniref:DUF397 domain-containing protein n=1 Tax=Nocardia sp. NPDC004068 TaxID=3364303 RepID=UPI0036B1F5C8